MTDFNPITRDRRMSGRRRWEMGGAIAQVFLITGYVAVATADLSGLTKAWSLTLLAAFSLFYIFVPGRCLFSSLPVKIAVVGTLIVLPIPQLTVMVQVRALAWRTTLVTASRTT